jgi:hypothetical protein
MQRPGEGKGSARVKCPKCGYERRAADTAPDWQCPSCQVAYVKAARAAAQANAPPTAAARPTATAAPGSPNGPNGPDEPDVLDDAGAEYYERLDLAASGQRLSIIAILLTFGLRGMSMNHATSAGVGYVLAVAVALLSLLGIVRMCSGLGHEQGRKIFCMVMAFVPVANIVTLVVLSVKATRMLRQAGWRVGLFGARP